MKPFLSLAEKALMTYLEALVTFLVAADNLGADKWTMAAVAAIPAALTIIANGLPVIPVGLPFLADALLRVVRTYVVTFIGVLVAAPVFVLSVDAAQAASIAGVTAALAVIKTLLASQVGRSNSAALLPKSLDLEPAAAA